MRLSRLSRLAIHGILLAAVPTVAAAQRRQAPPVAIGALSGASVVTSEPGDSYGTGVQVGALAELRTPVDWLAVRLDLGYRHFGMESFSAIDQNGRPTGEQYRQRMRLLSGTADVVVRIPDLRTRVRPYALAGVGRYRRAYRIEPSGGGEAGSASFSSNGVNAGAGLEAALSRVTVFAEARYERLRHAQLALVPISVGVRVP
jgi:opacity protein-like surface antigen